MNAETKRHIDAARQVLVGVVPNPTSQIDQITNALIYKFMDDMDQSAIKSGGDASFFTGDLEKYAWTRLMDTRVGNQERMNLYSEALVKFSESKQLPELFRNIFKSAYLPYRSPDVLGLFLKEIDYFNYSHPEELGNAYEYLLSIMSSQGDAGQFRTPRHIIDFIVEAVNPTKDDKVLDPACGTGGFLISAYKNILKHHDGKDDPKKKEKPLTPDQRRTLMQNFEGYDIDPGMVRIAQVNMYLHQFKNPKIVQYDSLSMDERWNDKFDVILANPPFMSPKGGVSTHNKFGIQSTRSEVLFVDYIMNHLRPKGRAGIIVPEGIMFKNDAPFKKLRENLVNDGLYAVVSLPSGVFQPYSGVKTSILFFDNEIAKKAKDILFINIANDGFDLGAQRRPINKNDIPEALEILNKWKLECKVKSTLVQYISKDLILNKDDFVLIGERYKIIDHVKDTRYPMVQLSEMLDYEQPTDYIVESVDYDDGYKTPVLTAGKTFILGYTNEMKGIFTEKLPVIIFDDFTTAIKFVDFPFKVKSSAMKILHVKENVADIRYVFYSMQRIQFKPGEHKRHWISQYSKFKIPLPPLDIQKEIVEKIEVKQKAIEGAKQVIENLERERDDILASHLGD
jgi:type I restriction enzyme M protein